MNARFRGVFSFVLLCVWWQARVEAQAAVNGAPASVAVVGKVEAKPQAQGLTIEIGVSAPVVPRDERLTNPERLVFDFPGCLLQGASRRIPVNIGPVVQLRLSLFQAAPPVTRVVVDSKEPLQFEVKPTGSGVLIEIAFPNVSSAANAATSSPAVAHGRPAASRELSKQAKPEVTVHATGSQLHAYGLLETAKALKVEDLQAVEDRAAAGDPEAQTTLALAYHSAVLLKRDEAEALRLLRRAADHGFMAAQETLGIFAETGIGMEQPAPAEALAWYTKAAQQGSMDAATNIGLMYADGKGVAKDPAQAVAWFRRAADGGDSAAQYNLALVYGRGSGVPRDYKESVRWLTAAADQNVIPAILDLAYFYMHPPDSTSTDVNRAIQYYAKAGDLGSGVAQAILGNIYATGEQGRVDYEQAVKWYRKAAEHGQPDGEFGLGVRYALGQGVPADLQEARRWFAAAAEQGQVDAQFDLATMNEEGKGAPADRAAAAYYYQLAANQGMVKAQYRYGLMLAGTRESRSDRVSAYKWFVLAQDTIKESGAALGDLRRSMSADEIAEAEREVDKWRVAHPGGQR